MGSTAGQKFDSLLNSSEFTVDPYPIYHQLRTEAPVYWCESWGAWVFSRFEDIRSIYLDADRFHSGGRIIAHLKHFPKKIWHQLALLREHFSVGLLHCDLPDHTRMRNLVSKAFTPNVIQSLRPRIQALVDELLDTVKVKGRMDVIEDFAFPLPATVISEMLGIPPTDRDQFRVWASGIIAFQGSARPAVETVFHAQDCVREARAYFRELFKERQRKKGDDLISGLVAAEEQGDKLSEAELMTTCVTMLIGGHETTTGLLSNGLFLLLKHPDQMQRLKDDLTLIPDAIYEMLRYESPVQRGFRLVKKDTKIYGTSIRKGDMLCLLLAAGNRDPQAYPDPDRFDITRDNKKHNFFGGGIHYCLGAPLATLEGHIVFKTLLQRFPDMKLENDYPQWEDASMLRRLKLLPVSI